MSRDSDDDALRWEGDDDPTLAPGWKTVGNPASPQPRHDPDADDDDGDDGGEGVASDDAPRASSAELVVLGVLGGVYLLYTVGWLIVATSEAPALADPVAQFMYALGRWFAVAAPALWFGAVLWLTSGRRRARLLWLIAGAVLLVPVPFLIRG